MKSRCLLVLMVDGWRARSIGAYGNTWYGTPALDRFASQSLLFDRYLTDSTELPHVYNSLSTGRHAKFALRDAPTPSLIDRLRNGGYQCHFVTDSQALLAHPFVASFDEATYVDTETTTCADSSIDTSFGKVFGTTAEKLGEWAGKPFPARLLWVHFHGFLAPWDASPDLAGSLVDEDDPAVTPTVDVPQQSFEHVEDAQDEIFLASCRYAGQVMALDECFGDFEGVLSEILPDMQLALVLGGTRGFALGEHGVIGLSDAPYGEQFHVPLLIRSPESGRSLQRDRSLVQPADVHAMLAVLAAGEPLIPPTSEFACGITSKGGIFIQNNEWHFVQPAPSEENEAKCELYVKPDDLWEANNIASRCRDVVDELAQTVAVLVDRTGEERRT